MSTKHYYKITATIFLLLALAHLVRVVQGWEAQIGEFEVPMWMSYVAILVAGYLAYRGFTTKRAK